jgi:hypothetical protein
MTSTTSLGGRDLSYSSLDHFVVAGLEERFIRLFVLFSLLNLIFVRLQSLQEGEKEINYIADVSRVISGLEYGGCLVVTTYRIVWFPSGGTDNSLGFSPL